MCRNNFTNCNKFIINIFDQNKTFEASKQLFAVVNSQFFLVNFCSLWFTERWLINCNVCNLFLHFLIKPRTPISISYWLIVFRRSPVDVHRFYLILNSIFFESRNHLYFSVYRTRNNFWQGIYIILLPWKWKRQIKIITNVGMVEMHAFFYFEKIN